MGVQEGDIRKDAGGKHTPPPAKSEAESPVANQSGPAEAETAQGSTEQPSSAANPAGGAANPEPTPDEAAMTRSDPAAGAGLEERLATAEAQRDEYLDLAQRTKADFENFRKRAARETADARTRAIADVVRELLPAIDNLERALVAIEETTTHENAQLGAGVRLVHDELHGILQRLGLSALDPAGHPFDPNVHEAVSTRPEDGTDAGVVLDVTQKGYLLGETVVRPARVVVSS